ncbi:MAG: DUF3656 domain-containing U32 family peptidase [Cellulosilyticaceae bacterium]
MKKVELLAPVGKLENAYAAIENGADAIFVGGKLFNARQFADNFNDNELEEIVRYCKLRDVKVYITVNTLVKNEELKEMYNYLQYLANLKVDALIVQDLGVVRMIKKYFPTLTIHASTQMTAHSIQDVELLKAEGFERVVLARELNLKEIKKIKEDTGVEIETFVHGALCYSYSGQCLFSSFIGGRSGNRGRCAQPCRMQYSLHEKGKPVVENLHLLSPKDICTLDLIPELIEAGIDSFKIEGRMKSPEYVASVVKEYRKYIDEALEGINPYSVAEEDVAELQSIFNRGGFSQGYYHQKAGRDMLTEKTPKNIGLKIGHVVDYNPKTKMVTIYTNKALNPGDGLEIWNTHKHTGTGISKYYEANEKFTVPVTEKAEKGSAVYLSKNHTLLKELKKTYERSNRKVVVSAKVVGRIGEPIRYTLKYKDLEVTVTGELLEKAMNAPTQKENVIKQLSKLGTTSFKLQDFKIEWDEEAFIVISKLNDLRRQAVTLLEEKITARAEQNKKEKYKDVQFEETRLNSQYGALVNSLEQLQSCLEENQIQTIYWEWHYNDEITKKALTLCEKQGKTFYLALPYIMREPIWEKYKKQMAAWQDTGIEGYLCRTYGQFNYLNNGLKKLRLDYNLNVLNNEAVMYWAEKGAEVISASMELSKAELKEMKGPLERIIYGHLPLMTTEQCILGNYKMCNKTHTGNYDYTLKDRKESLWQLTTDCKACKMQVLTEYPLLTLPGKDLGSTSFAYYRLNFTKESGLETKAVLEHVFQEIPLRVQVAVGNFLKSIE